MKLRFFAGLTIQEAAEPSAYRAALRIATGLMPKPGCFVQISKGGTDGLRLKVNLSTSFHGAICGRFVALDNYGQGSARSCPRRAEVDQWTKNQSSLQPWKSDSPDAGAAFLDEACETNTKLRAESTSYSGPATKPGSFLESPAAGLSGDRPITGPSPKRPGTVIGPYKLLQQIGEGGMGVVFMAEQTEPIQRTVALKIIKPGMDTRQVIARFEAERQAVAMMDHPNIAKVLDAGTTDSGRPYFVMELVKGVPITKYCDEKHLPLRARLELFMQVCQAVQHAHQKGIIHRDIKPNNVLVAEYDNHAVPKVIDFGVAKATAQKLTERTMFTEFGQVLGTMEYMSPEQAKFNQLDIDTRSDIYSLGVLLYELLGRLDAL